MSFRVGNQITSHQHSYFNAADVPTTQQGDAVLSEFRNRVASDGFTIRDGWEPKPGFVYDTVRAISARINQNYDGWPAEELKKSHHTFIGKPLFVNHHNENPERARGVVVASRFVENGDDKYIEVIQEVDAERFPKLAKEIIEGGMDSVSMGAEASRTICSACDNEAESEEDLCDCVKYHKGEKIRVAGKSEPVLVWEKCAGIHFFELSYVFDPADETAVVSKVVHAHRRRRIAEDQQGGVDVTPGEMPFSVQDFELGLPEAAEAFGGGLGLSGVTKGLEGVGDIAGNMGGTALSSPASGSADPQSFQTLANKRISAVESLHMSSRRRAFGETEAPESIDTLRPEESSAEDDFHHYVESPPELQDPDLSRTHQLDREQEGQGLDGDRRVEDLQGYTEDGMEDLGVLEDEGEPGAPPMDSASPEVVVEEFVQWCDEAYAPVDERSLELWAQEVQAAPEEIEIVAGFLQEVNPGKTDDVAEPFPNVNEGSDISKGITMAGRDSLAQRGRVASAGRKQHFADNSGHTDGGPYYVDDQGEQEDIYLTQVPPAEAVAVPDRGDSPISNTEQNLVAALQRSTAQTTYLANQLHHFREANARYAYDENAPFWDEPKTGKPGPVKNDGKPNPVKSEYHPGSGVDKKSARYATDNGDVKETAVVVNPPLSGTDEQSLKGDDFITPNPQASPKETQPKDASVHGFKMFDQWLANTQNRQRTASLYTNDRFIIGQVKRWAKATGNDPRVMFPVLASVLRQAKKDVNTRQANESLEVAAPQDRIDVEAPVKNLTDADAQASQYDKGDFASNAGDDIADPDLSTDLSADLEGWSSDGPTKKSSAVKTADAAQAVRLAEAYIKAGLLDDSEKWTAVAQFQKMRAGQVIDRTRLLEATISQVISPLKNKVASGGYRGTVPQGIPSGLASGAGFNRSAATHRTAENDPSNDFEFFL